MPTSTATHPKLLWPGIKDLWADYFYNRHEAEYSQVFEVTTSNKAFEEYKGITGYGLAPKKTEGATLTYDEEGDGYLKRFTNVAYALGYVVTHEEQMDNLYKQVSSRRAPAIARSMAHTVETLAADHFNNASTDSAAYQGADGVGLLSAAHPNVNGGTWSNELATAADLSEAAVEDLMIQMMQATDDRGLKMALKSRCLLVHPSEWFNANRIYNSVLRVDTANNDTNVIRDTGVFPDGIKVNHWLTDADAWFIKTDCPTGLIFQWRERPTFDKDNDFDTKNLKASGYMRFASGWVDPRAVYGSMGG